MTFFKSIFLILFVGFTILAKAQSGCGSAAPFCSGPTSYTFPAGTSGTSAAAGPDYGCLFSQPNPAWYYFQVSTSGTIIIDIAGSAGGDVDFICWGPFTSATGNCGSLTAGNTVDCSFSASATETCTIAGAIAGEFYMLLITNFSGIPQNINFGQNSASTGSTDCSILSSSTSQTICPGKTATLTATSNLVGPTYLWTPGGATTSSITVSPAITTIYTVTTSGLDPVSSTPTVVVNTSTVTVLAVPSLTLSSNSPVCAGSNIILTASPGFTNYVWSGPPAYSATTTVATVTRPSATTSMVGTYTVIGRTVAGCTVSAVTTVSVIPSPTLTITASSNTLCVNNTATLTCNSLGATGYTWSPAGTLGSPSSSITSATPLTTTNYTVTVSVGTCTSSAVKTISVIPSPIIAVLSTTNTTCGLCNGIITTSASAGSAPYSYTWAPSVSTQSIISSLCAGNYSVTIEDANKCKSTFNTNIAGSSVFQASLSASSNETFQGEPVSLSGIGGVTYTWTPNSNLSCSVCPVTIATPMDDISYCVDVSSIDGCKDTACVDVFVKCGDVFVPNAFSPNNDGHNDELGVYGNCIKELIFRVYDRWGEIVFESDDVSKRWDGKYKGYAVTSGVFIYQLSAKLKSGTVINKRGNITLVK